MAVAGAFNFCRFLLVAKTGRMMTNPEVNKHIYPDDEIKRVAARIAQYRARAARWDLDVAVFFFAVISIVMILTIEGIGIEIVAPSAILGLALGWLMGWKKGQQAYERFYNEEYAKLLSQQTMISGKSLLDAVQKALREGIQRNP
ncbi:hypothetical protein ACFLVJ_01070 [Chloroflexota bacterium]